MLTVKLTKLAHLKTTRCVAFALCRSVVTTLALCAC